MPRKKKITLNSPQNEKFIPQEEEFIPQEEELVQQEEELVQQEEESLKQLGQRIRDARIAKNLSLESVSGHLHIAVKILEAIEDGDPGKGPKPVFLRGLVRTYCNYLGVDQTNVVEKIEKLLKSSETGKQQLKTLKPVFEIRESHSIRNISVFLVIVSGGYLLYSIYFEKIPFFLAWDNNTQSKTVMVGVEDKLSESEKFVVADDGIVKSPKSLKQSEHESILLEKNNTQLLEAPGEKSSIDDSPIVKTDANIEINSAKENINEISGIDQDPTEKDSSSKIFDIESEKNVKDLNQKNISELSQTEDYQDLLVPLTLEVEATEGTWISISVDGNEAKDIRLSIDEIHQWEAKKEYLLTLGNTHVVRILLNGREIETDRTHQLLTDWIIDKSFLP